MSYDIFLHLEAATSQELVRGDKTVAAYGVVPHPADARYNPDGLPIGVTKTVMPDGPWKIVWQQLRAACPARKREPRDRWYLVADSV
jgi:hypothetical protein